MNQIVIFAVGLVLIAALVVVFLVLEKRGDAKQKARDEADRLERWAALAAYQERRRVQTANPSYPQPATSPLRSSVASIPDTSSDLLNPLNPFSPLWIGHTSTDSVPSHSPSSSDYSAPSHHEQNHHHSHDTSSYSAPDTSSYSSSDSSSSYDSGSSSSDSGSSSSGGDW